MAASGPTPVGSKQKWCYLRSFVYTRAAWWSSYTRSNQDSVYTRSLKDSVYTRSLKDSVYTRSLDDSVYTRWCSFTHTSGRYTPVERLRQRLRDCLREARLLGDDACWGRLVSPISTTVGGWARRSKTAASGRAASIMTRVSGRWARGSSGYTTPGLSLIASPASRVGQVI